MRLSKKYFRIGFVIVVALGSISLFCMSYKYNTSTLIEGEVGMLFQKTTEVTSYKLEVRLEDAIRDDKLIQFYEEDIQDVENLTNGNIMIKSCDIDLNEDGLIDKLVSIISPLHSGSHGDSFQILLNDEGVLRKIFSATLLLYDQGGDYGFVGDIYILNNKSNGFYDIKIVTDGNSFILYYEGDRYIRSDMSNIE